MAIYLGTNQVGVNTNFNPDGYLKNGRLLTTKTYSFNLGQTNFSSLTPSDTAQTLTLPATNYTAAGGTTMTCFKLGADFDGTIINRSEHDYTIFYVYNINYNYGTNNVTSTIHPIKYSYVKDYIHGKYSNSISTSTGERTYASWTLTGSTSTTTTSALLYQDAGNSYRGTTTTTYGLYLSNTTMCSFGSTSNVDYLELRSGTISLKTGTYVPLEALQAVNASQTIITLTWYIYEGDRGYYTNLYDLAWTASSNQPT